MTTKLQETDSMPREVAIEILTGKRITNRMKKNCLAALQTVHVPTAESKNPAERLVEKFQTLPIDRVNRIVKRCKKRSRMVKGAIIRAVFPEVKSKLENVLYAVTLTKAVAEVELERRQDLTLRIPLVNLMEETKLKTL